jgi:hypothetical protein
MAVLDFLTDNVGLIKSGLGLFQQFQAGSRVQEASQRQAETIRIGGELAAQGSLLSAAGLREQIKSVSGATQFNLQIDRTNLQRQLSSASRQFERTVGRQMVQQAGTGLAIGSKSFLQLRNEASDVFGRGMLNLKIDAENNRRAKVFESEVTKTNLENQARAAEFRASADRVTASNRAASAAFQGEIAKTNVLQNVIKSVPTLLGQLFQE